MGPFTSVFGMGTGVASPLWPPGKPGPGLSPENKATHSLGGNGSRFVADGGDPASGFK